MEPSSFIIFQILILRVSCALGYAINLEYFQPSVNEPVDFVSYTNNFPSATDDNCNIEVRDKILGTLLGGSVEQALYQMELTDPGILENLADDDSEQHLKHAQEPNTNFGCDEEPDANQNRRFLFTPTIQNTVINNNNNENTISASNQMNQNQPPAVPENANLPYVPYPVVVNPNFPLLTYVLSGLLKGSAKVEHKGHKPTKICFEL